MSMLGKLWGYLGGAGVVVLAVLGALFGARRSGEKEAQVEATKKSLDQAKESNAIDKTVRAEPDDAIATELRKYQRD